MEKFGIFIIFEKKKGIGCFGYRYRLKSANIECVQRSDKQQQSRRRTPAHATFMENSTMQGSGVLDSNKNEKRGI